MGEPKVPSVGTFCPLSHNQAMIPTPSPVLHNLPGPGNWEWVPRHAGPVDWRVRATNGEGDGPPGAPPGTTSAPLVSTLGPGDLRMGRTGVWGAGLKCGGQSEAERSGGPLLSPQKPPLCSLVSGDLLPNPQAAHPDTVGAGTLSKTPRNVPTVLLWEPPRARCGTYRCARVIANGFGGGGGGGKDERGPGLSRICRRQAPEEQAPEPWEGPRPVRWGGAGGGRW